MDRRRVAAPVAAGAGGTSWRANAHCYMPAGVTAQRDIAGNFMMWDVTTLTKRLTRKHRRKGGTQCFTLTTTAECSECLACWRSEVPRGRTEKLLTRNRKIRLDQIKRFEREHAMALNYEAETARLRQVSGADAAIERTFVFLCRGGGEAVAVRMSQRLAFEWSLRADYAVKAAAQ